MTETITIPGYSITSKLGQGGMASVYLAVQHSFERQVALKVMSPLLNSDPTFAARFKREARIVAQLGHASIVPVYEVGEHQSCHYLSMEYLSGGDLKRRILDGERDLSLALNVCTGLGAALDVAHRKGFVHRDIKPENILFREDGTPVLTDFGIARAVDSGRSMTLAGMLVGTPDYMSPEQVKGLELDGRSDLYSLGIVFYEILTGTVPFKADSNLSVALKQVGEPLPPLPPEYVAYQEFLDCLTAKDREDRFASGAEVIRALRVIGTARGVRTRPVGRSPTAPAAAPTAVSSTAPPAALPGAETLVSRPTLARPAVARSPTAALYSPEPPAELPEPQVSALRRPTPSPEPAMYAPEPPRSPEGTLGAREPVGSAQGLSSPGAVGSTDREKVAVSPSDAGDRAADEIGRSQHWMSGLAVRGQPIWMGAAALAALAVGVTLIVGSLHKSPSASPDKAAPSTTTRADTPARPDPAGGSAVATQNPMSASANGSPASAAVAQTPPPVAPAPPASGSTPTSTAAPTSGTQTAGIPPVQTGVPPSGDAATAPPEDDVRAQAEVARRKHLREERRQRKEEETRLVEQHAAELRAEQLKEQEARIQELLVAAKSEYSAGALWQPAGDNAADHYREVLRMQPDQAEALAGARRLANVLAAEAAQRESIGDVYNARLLIDQVQSLQPDHPKLSDLQARLEQLEATPTSPDARDRFRLELAKKYMARVEKDLDHKPLDFKAVDDATDQYDRALSSAPMAPGLPSLKERLIAAYPIAVQTELSNNEPKRAQKLINNARKRKWSSDELEQLAASLQSGSAATPGGDASKSGNAPTASIKEAGAGGTSH